MKRADNNIQQIWSLEKFENRIVDMREMYREGQSKDLETVYILKITFIFSVHLSFL